MKKLFLLLLSLTMALSLTACGEELTDAVLDLAIDMITETDTDQTEDYQDAVDAIGGVDGPVVTVEAVIDGSNTAEGSASTGNSTQAHPPRDEDESPSTTNGVEEELIDEDGYYYSKEDVSLYLITYGELPDNYITKDEARDLGWTGGSVEDYAPGCAIGGDVFGNYEGLLPKAKGRVYYECDIDTDGYYSRGSRRIVFSNDGLIYYTHDHYESFELLYGEE